MKLTKPRQYGCRRNEMGLPSSPKTEYLTNRLIKMLESIELITHIEREKYIRNGVSGYAFCFKDVYAEEKNGSTWGFEIKTHVGDITHSEHGKNCDSCNYNYFVVSPDCFYHIVKYLQENNLDHVGVIVGNRYWLDTMIEAERIG